MFKEYFLLQRFTKNGVKRRSKYENKKNEYFFFLIFLFSFIMLFIQYHSVICPPSDHTVGRPRAEIPTRAGRPRGRDFTPRPQHLQHFRHFRISLTPWCASYCGVHHTAESRVPTFSKNFAVCIPPRSQAPQCASYRGVKLRSVLHTGESSSAESKSKSLGVFGCF